MKQIISNPFLVSLIIGLTTWLYFLAGWTCCKVSPPPATDFSIVDYLPDGGTFRGGGSAYGECLKHYVAIPFAGGLTLAAALSLRAFRRISTLRRTILAALFVVPWVLLFSFLLFVWFGWTYGRWAESGI